MSRSRYEAPIREALEKSPQDVAIGFDGIPFTWAEAKMVAYAVEQALIDAGLPENAKVGLIGRNRPAHFAALWGIFISGCCTSMVHAHQPAESLAGDIATNRWPVVFGEPRDWTPEVVAAADSVGTVGYAFTNDPSNPIERLTRTAKPGPLTDRHADDDSALQLLSSGTTGKPKRISLSRTAADDMIKRTVDLFELAGPAANAAQIMPWPLASLGGPNGALPAAVLRQQLAVQEKFDAPRMLEMIRRYRPPFLSLPPSALGMLLQLNPPLDTFAGVKLITTGSAPLDPNVHRRLMEEYKVPVAVTYGATEFAGLISGWTPDDLKYLAEKRGSVGRALPGMKIRIVSRDTGEVLPPRQTGLVEAIVPRIGPDWVSTTDLGFLDEEGFLYLEGRADDAIIRGGFKILPEEVINVLRTHPKVGDAAMIGLPDERVGMLPAAVVEKRVGAPAPTPEELEKFLRSKLVAYKVPARFLIVDEIPRTETMKPKREALRALFVR